MRSLKTLFVAAVVTVLALVPAQAVTFNFSFTGDGGLSGSGQLIGDLVSGNQYSLTGISGTVFDGASYSITTLSPYAGADQQLFYAAANLVSFAGISFSTALQNYNIFTDGGAIHYGLLGSIENPVGYPNPNRAIAFAVSQTPIPAPLLLFGTGLGLLGLIRQRTRRQGASA